MSTPRILVEGGPVDVRSKHLLALLVGLVIGGGIGFGTDTITALKASHNAHEAVMEVQKSRREQCQLANERHKNVLTELHAVVTGLPTTKRLEAEAQEANTERLLNAITPLRDCSKL